MKDVSCELAIFFLAYENGTGYHKQGDGASLHHGDHRPVEDDLDFGGLHSTEVAYLLLTQQPRIRFPAFLKNF